jgi:beta-glucosidase
MISEHRPKYFIPLSFMFGSLLLSCGYNKENALKAGQSQQKLEYRTVKTLDIDGLKFKDLNKNNQLDVYEDWRLSADERSIDLVSKLSLEQKAGLMLISTTLMENDAGRGPSEKPITSGFSESDQVSETNFFTKKPLAAPMMSSAGTTKDVEQFYKRHFILRANTAIDTLAKWANRLQELCEKGDFGIPATIASNPRNHISTDASVGLSMGRTAFTAFPGELGLAAMRDFDLVREFADISRQEWRAVGLNKGYMYMADLATEPRWQRIEGTFGEDAELAARMIKEIVLGFQGDSLNATSVALTTKHFPGGGSGEGGQDPHFDWGKKGIYPGGMFERNLIPFKAAIDAGTSAIMPYYSLPSGTEYEEVGFAFNKRILQDVLRDQLGFKGIINSDTGPIEMMPWGVEDLSIQERYKKALDAGVNLFSGQADPSLLLNTLKKYPELLPLVDASVHKILIEKFQLGIFENPYVEVAAASQIIGNDNFKKKADEALRKSIVLLRNEEGMLPLKAKTKVYFETYLQSRGGTPSNVFISERNDWNIEFANTPAEADVVLLWLIPKGPSLFQSQGGPLHVNLSNNGIDVDYVNKMSATKPTILAINYTNPWAIDEVYQEDSKTLKGILATFGTTPEAVLDVVTGKFKPSGKMPFTTPVSDEMAQKQKSDLPGYMEGSSYGLFQFDEGLTY